MDPGKGFSVVTATSLVPVTGLALPLSPELPSPSALPLSLSLSSSLFPPRAPLSLSAPSSAATLSSMGSMDQEEHFTSCSKVWHLRVLSGVSQGAWLKGGHDTLPSANNGPHASAKPASHCSPSPSPLPTRAGRVV